jgi:hypothetical protein
MNEQEIQSWEWNCRYYHKTGNLSPWKIKLLKENGFDFNAQKSSKFFSFKDAKTFVHSLGFKKQKEWYEYCKSGKRHHNIPALPPQIYKNEWKSWSDFLGTKIGFDGKWLDFNDAKKISLSLKLKNFREWNEYCKSGEKWFVIPSNPHQVYKNKGWISWSDWLGGVEK